VIAFVVRKRSERPLSADSVEQLTARAEGARSSENHPAKVPSCKQRLPSGLP